MSRPKIKQERKALFFHLSRSLGYCCPHAMLTAHRAVSTYALAAYLGVNDHTVRRWRHAMPECRNFCGCQKGLIQPISADTLARIQRKAHAHAYSSEALGRADWPSVGGTSSSFGCPPEGCEDPGGEP